MTAYLRNRLPFGVALTLLLLASGWAGATECFVLSAGVDNYPHAGRLNGCINDARNTSGVFHQQQGKLFTRVHADTLVDGQATHGALIQRMQNLARVGNAGDVVVIFLSGHGGRTNDNQSWYFLPYDYDARRHGQTALTDRQILDSADVLVNQGKKVFIIVDACYSGQLRISAQNYLGKHRNPQGGGLVLMLSSSANQTSAALGQYSAFAKAFVDAMNAGDLNRDGKVTIDEIRRYSYSRTHDLIREHGQTGQQDCEVAWSPSISGNMPVAMLQQVAVNPQPQPQPQPQTTVWTGNEDLASFGRLSFHFHTGGRVQMHDAAGWSEGQWRRDGSQITLWFSNGRVVYTGTMHGATMYGTARNDRTAWNWSVTESTGGRR